MAWLGSEGKRRLLCGLLLLPGLLALGEVGWRLHQHRATAGLRAEIAELERRKAELKPIFDQRDALFTRERQLQRGIDVISYWKRRVDIQLVVQALDESVGDDDAIEHLLLTQDAVRLTPADPSQLEPLAAKLGADERFTNVEVQDGTVLSGHAWLDWEQVR
ncbi:MAG: hypothetical protein AAF533_03170 [Acidobacteriota bacterium]